MIAVDTNLLVYAHREDSPFHSNAYSIIQTLAEGPAPWAIPWPCVYEFFSVVTHPRIYKPPTPFKKALEQIDAWLESPRIVLLSETLQMWPHLKEILELAHVSGPLVHDARIATLCIHHGISELWTADRDMSRFSKLTTRNPLVQTNL